jgi:hypothetical protein
MSKMSYSNDRIIGLKGEDDVMPLINTFFKREIKKHEERYSTYDFYDDKYKYELKTRTNAYNTYPTTIVSVSKLVVEKVIFLFKFTDGLYYIKYKKDLFDTFEKKMFVRTKREGINDVEREHLFIPIDKLKKIVI